jgi:hypothetical protein
MVHEFVIHMIKHERDVKTQNNFINGIKDVKQYAVSEYKLPFEKLSKEQKITVVRYFQNEGENFTGKFGKFKNKVFDIKQVKQPSANLKNTVDSIMNKDLIDKIHGYHSKSKSSKYAIKRLHIENVKKLRKATEVINKDTLWTEAEKRKKIKEAKASIYHKQDLIEMFDKPKSDDDFNVLIKGNDEVLNSVYWQKLEKDRKGMKEGRKNEVIKEIQRNINNIKGNIKKLEDSKDTYISPGRRFQKNNKTYESEITHENKMLKSYTKMLDKFKNKKIYIHGSGALKDMFASILSKTINAVVPKRQNETVKSGSLVPDTKILFKMNP